jgi:hypothetical protein
MVDATKVEQDGPILLGANKLLHTGSSPVLTTNKLKLKVMKEYRWGRLMTSNQIGLMITWGSSTVPNRRYISLDIPFLIIQIYI